MDPTRKTLANGPVAVRRTSARALTAPRQDDAYTTTALVAALEAAWAAIRHHHRDVPAVVLVVGTGSPRRSGDGLIYGHFATSTWQHGPRRLSEVMVSGEGLTRTPEEVMSTLLHEAAHGIADARRIKDTSRQGRWHNQRFAAIAREVGLDVTKDQRIGWSPSTIEPAAAAMYTDLITRLGETMGAYRRIDLPARSRATSNSGNPAECGCGRRLRITPSVLSAGPVLCGLCGAEFTHPDNTGDQS
jgi:hypothetical protein